MKSFLKNWQTSLILLLIILAGGVLRLYQVNWDQGYHLHPDERMITIVTTDIHWPLNDLEWGQLLTPESPLNPKFFAYGSFPIYLLKSAGYIASFFDPIYSSYDSINLIGRVISALFDISTILFLFLLAKKIFNFKVGLIAAFLYSISVLPIQLSHFYAVDTLLTFFIIGTLYFLTNLYHDLKIRWVIFTGIFFGLSLSTKTSAILLVVPVFITFLINLVTSDMRYVIRKSKLITYYLLLITLTLVTFSLTEPYALIDSATFLRQTQEQQMMTKSAFTFPYTLQYVGKVPIIYEIKNIFYWGLGPFITLAVFLGLLYFHFELIKNKRITLFIIIAYFWIYFLTVSNFAIGFMRYLLPIYPLLCLFGGLFIWKILVITQQFLSRSSYFILHTSYFILLLVWPLSFINIYQSPNTRVQATSWINQNIPLGSTIATEHWDDGLPLDTQSYFNIYQLSLYDPDTPQKWQMINTQLMNTDYIILASNRLYTPLQKLTDCQNLPYGRCYTQTAQYYQDIFNGQLGFKKVAEFSEYPKIPFTNYLINDTNADESFTVYDHPKIIIFQKQ